RWRPTGPSEFEVQHGLRLLRIAVALVRGQRLEERLDPTDGDLAEAVVLERRHHQLAHVAFVEGPCARRQSAFKVQVGEPDLHELLERAVGGQLSAAAVRRPLRELLLEPMFSELPARRRRLDAPDLAVEVAYSGSRSHPRGPERRE